MMKPFKSALRGGRRRLNTGETLTETLIGVLIVSLATLVLLGGIAATARIRQKADDARRSFAYHETSSSSGTVAVTGDGKTFELSVTEKNDGTFYWYEYVG